MVTRDILANRETTESMADEATLAEQDPLASPGNLVHQESLVLPYVLSIALLIVS